MLKLSNLVTALFGIIAALGTILGIGSLGNANRIANPPSEQVNPDLDPTVAATPSNGITGLTAQDILGQSGSRQVGQSATNPSDAATTTAEGSAAKTTAQNPSAEFVVQGEGAVLTAEPAPPSTPSEATAVQLDPSPGVAAPATVPTPEPVAQAPEPRTVPAPAPAPVRAMW